MSKLKGLRVVKKAKCKYNHLSHKWENGDEDRYCTNDECHLCTCPILDDDCKDCKYYEKSKKVQK